MYKRIEQQRITMFNIIAYIVKLAIIPVALIGWFIEWLINKVFSKQFEFHTRTASLFFIALSIVSSASIASEGVISIILFYPMVSIELLCLWVCICISFGKASLPLRLLLKHAKRNENLKGDEVIIRSSTIIQAVFSYFYNVYFFGVLYFNLYNYDNKCFDGIEITNSTLSKLVDFLYFSTATMGTIGYGDITPHSMATKLLVMMQSFINIFFVVFIFSLIVSYNSSRLLMYRDR